VVTLDVTPTDQPPNTSCADAVTLTGVPAQQPIAGQQYLISVFNVSPGAMYSVKVTPQ
jgi:hypothetical protein